MTPVEMSTMERIDHHINTIQSGYGDNKLIITVATVNSFMGNLKLFYNSPTCPKIMCARYIETVSSWAQNFEDILHRYEHEIRNWSLATHANIIKLIIKDLMKNPRSRCQCDTGWVWVLEQLSEAHWKGYAPHTIDMMEIRQPSARQRAMSLTRAS
jgi:thymidylate synthase